MHDISPRHHQDRGAHRERGEEIEQN
jgi:hypothetical protein